MVDRLKRSLEQLDPPICPKCSIEMVWSRSTLVDAATVSHVFICTGCSHTAETKTTIPVTNTPPNKLSAPRDRQAA
jgi:transcription elongation factor Elf1